MPQITATYTIITHTLSSGAVFAVEYRATSGEIGIMALLALAILALVVFNWRWKK